MFESISKIEDTDMFREKWGLWLLFLKCRRRPWPKHNDHFPNTAVQLMSPVPSLLYRYAYHNTNSVKFKSNSQASHSLLPSNTSSDICAGSAVGLAFKESISFLSLRSLRTSRTSLLRMSDRNNQLEKTSVLNGQSIPRLCVSAETIKMR